MRVGCHCRRHRRSAPCIAARRPACPAGVPGQVFGWLRSWSGSLAGRASRNVRYGPQRKQRRGHPSDSAPKISNTVIREFGDACAGSTLARGDHVCRRTEATAPNRQFVLQRTKCCAKVLDVSLERHCRPALVACRRKSGKTAPVLACRVVGANLTVLQHLCCGCNTP